MIVKGTIVVLTDNIAVSDKFTKRDLVVAFKNERGYDQYINIGCSLDFIRKGLDNFGIGQEIEVEVAVGGRQWTSPGGEIKYFNSIDCVKILTPSKPSSGPVEDDKDLPF